MGALLPPAAPIRVLVVDDSPVFLAALWPFLEDDPGLEVVAYACSGEEAIAKVTRLQPDLVLTDLDMPGMTGLELARHLKGGPRPPRVIVMTFHGEYRGWLRESAADGFLSKTELTDLAPLIRTLFTRPGGSPAEGQR